MWIVNPIDKVCTVSYHRGMSKVRVFSFDVSGGRQADPERPGKSTWPHCIHIHMDKYRAGLLAEELVRYLTTAREGDSFTYSTMGKLMEIDEDTEEVSEELEGLKGN